MSDLIRDMKQTVRRLGRTPLFTLATLVTLALGIGANTAIFSVINSVLLKPLPYPEPERLAAVLQTAPGVNIKDLGASIADYVTYREDSKTLADVAIFNGGAVTVTEFGQPERVDGIYATFRLLPMLGVQPILGRAFTETDNQNGSPDVAMISYGYWQRRFGGDPKVIGRRILMDATAREIVGVLPKGFWILDRPHDMILPLQFDRAQVHLAGYNFQAIGRLRPGVTMAQVNADIERMIAIELRKFPPPQGMSPRMMLDARLAPNARSLAAFFEGDTGKSLWVVMATIGMVLLIACANVANLLLVRAEGRSHELAIRAALGAGRGRLARELYMESLALALAGGAAGVGFALGLVRLVLAISPAKLPRMDQISVDSTALLFTVLVSVIAGIAFGTIPVLKHGGATAGGALRAGGRTSSASHERNFARNTLTVVQVALALILLVGSGLMIRTFQSMRRVHPGFSDPATLETLRLSVPDVAKSSPAAIPMMHQNVRNRLASLPGVSDVSLISALPMTGASSQDPIAASDHEYRENQIPPLRRFITAAPGTFGALGVPVIAGREYTWEDILAKRDVVIISENFAREYWGSAPAAIGKQIRSNPRDHWSQIVGVVGDVRHDGVDQKAPSTVYWPLRERNSMIYLVRSSRAGTEALSSEIRQAVAEVNRGIPVTDVRSMQEIYDKSMGRTAFTLTLLAMSGGMALLLAVVGIYAVIAYTVEQRRREIGIRMALGAQQSNLKLLFVRNGVVLAAIGSLAGLAVAATLSRLMSTLLFEVNPVDPLTYSAVALFLLGASIVASYLPARRVTQVDPVEALRAE